MLRSQRRISESHRDAFLERYKGLRSWAVQMTANDQALAEDLLHDLFILFTLNQPDLKRIQNLDNYLYTCLRNLHISQLRRATRGRFEQLSLVEYDSARLGLHSAHGRDWIQVQDELRRICHYANVRKETANAASVLILRFFHGYYPSEIAKVLRTSRAAVDKRLMAARSEAKAYLATSNSLSFINKEQVASAPEVFPAKFARTLGDFLLELRETIFQARPGVCLSSAELKDLYQSKREAPIARKHVAHLVSCPVCLDTTNSLLCLPLLAERYPTDTMDKDNKKSGGPPDAGDMGDKGGAVRKLKDWEREAREAFEHKPQELCVSVNGYLLGSQLIGSELSELTLNVTADERISFCEVFSEQGVRLMMMNVDELPPNGPGELSQRVNLSEARMLESKLLFNNPFPTLNVTYHDPALAVEAVQDTEVTESSEIASASSPQQSRIKRLRLSSPSGLDRPISRFGKALHDRFLNFQFWLRPATVTTLVAVCLIAATLFLYLRRPETTLTAADVLQRAALAEHAIGANLNQVLHRTVSLKVSVLGAEATGSGRRLISRRKIEVWQSAANGISARRLFDEKGSLIAGDWRRADGVQTLYHHGSRPQIKPIPGSGAASSLINFDNAWQFLPSAKDFTSLIGSSAAMRIDERVNDYLIRFEVQDSASSADTSAPSAATASRLLQATLILSKSDLHPTEETLLIQQGPEIREFSFIEASFERRPSSTVAPAVFEPDVELLNPGLSPKSTSTPSPKDSATINPTAPARIVATAELEVEVLRLLNQVGADMGEQINVTRTPEGLLHIQGLTQTDKRKRELLAALVSLSSNPAVRVDIQTLNDALQKQPKQNTSPKSVRIETAQPASNTIAVDEELRSYLAGRGISEVQLDEAVRQFSDRALGRSLRVLKHAAALKALAQRFSPEDLRTLKSDAKLKWLQLIKHHAEKLQQESAALRREVAPVFSMVGQPGGEAADVGEADLPRAAQHLFQICSENDRAVRLAFSISPDSSNGDAIKGAQFWRSVATAEAIAEKIGRQY